MNLLSLLTKSLMTDASVNSLSQKTGVSSSLIKKLLPLIFLHLWTCHVVGGCGRISGIKHSFWRSILVSQVHGYQLSGVHPEGDCCEQSHLLFQGDLRERIQVGLLWRQRGLVLRGSLCGAGMPGTNSHQGS